MNLPNNDLQIFHQVNQTYYGSLIMHRVPAEVHYKTYYDERNSPNSFSTTNVSNINYQRNIYHKKSESPLGNK